MRAESLTRVPTPWVKPVARRFHVFIQRFAALIGGGRFFFSLLLLFPSLPAGAEPRQVILGEKLRVEAIFR